VAPRDPDALVVAAGTTAEVERVAMAAAMAGARCVALAQPVMACGTGLCWTCTVPVGDGAPVRACLTGPALDVGVPA